MIKIFSLIVWSGPMLNIQILSSDQSVGQYTIYFQDKYLFSQNQFTK